MVEVKHKLLQVSTMDQLKFFKDELVTLIELFLKKSKSVSNTSRILGYIITQLSNPYFRLYVAVDGEYKLTAYYIINIVLDIDTEKLQAFIYQHCSNNGLLPDINNQIEDLLKLQNVKGIKFITKRNDKAFLKSLGDKWKPTGTVIEKQLGG